MMRVAAGDELWASTFIAWAARLRSLPETIHPHWLEILGSAPRPGVPWQDWAEFLQIGPLLPGELGDGVLRLALLPPLQGRYVLILRALVAHAAEVRRCIEPELRASIISEIGYPSWKALIQDAHAFSATRQLPKNRALLPPELLVSNGVRADPILTTSAN